MTELAVIMQFPDAARSAVAGSTILKRAASPEEIARVIVFVATEAGSYLTGATIAADAGRTAA